MRTLRITVSLGALGLALALTGCGASAVTRAQVIARADAICASTLRAVRVSGTASAHVTSVVPLIATEVRQLTALPRPPEDRALLNRYLAAMRGALTQWRALAAAQTSGSTQATAAALTALSANPAPALAGRYGLRGCAAAGATVGSGATATTG